jgi:hypothetical protein
VYQFCGSESAAAKRDASTLPGMRAAAAAVPALAAPSASPSGRKRTMAQTMRLTAGKQQGTGVRDKTGSPEGVESMRLA